MKILLISLGIIIFTFLYSQNHYVKQLGIEQGLSNNYVVNITQDKDGFLWFATEEGLNKFDGSRFINYYIHTNHLSWNELYLCRPLRAYYMDSYSTSGNERL